ncbi:MAG: hypothetical protein OEX22_04760 [Cyclobacteriaceae bacterium]|nr:hypothetical protein [Cyclobacteriaceae bacterium]
MKSFSGNLKVSAEIMIITSNKGARIFIEVAFKSINISAIKREKVRKRHAPTVQNNIDLD